jgi:hypothetical protein
MCLSDSQLTFLEFHTKCPQWLEVLLVVANNAPFTRFSPWGDGVEWLVAFCRDLIFVADNFEAFPWNSIEPRVMFPHDRHVPVITFADYSAEHRRS